MRGLKSIAREGDPPTSPWLVNTFVDGRVTSQQWGGALDTVGLQYASNITTVTDRLSNQTQYQYNGQGQLALERALDSENGNAETSYQIDLLQRVNMITSPRGNRIEYEFQSDDKPLLRDQVIKETRRPADVPGLADDGEVETTLLSRDTHGDLLATTDPRDKATTFTRDAAGEPLSIKRTRPAAQGGGTETAETGIKRNDYGQVTEEQGPETGQLTRYDYWPETNPGGISATSALAVGLDATTGGYLRCASVYSGSVLRTTTEYDPLGRVASVTNPAGGKVSYTYYPRGTLENEYRRNGSQTSSVHHTYDARGFPDTTGYAHAGGQVLVDEDYDVLGFRTRQEVHGPGLPGTGVITQWIPNNARGVEKVIHPRGWSEEFEYDKRGRLKKKTRKATDTEDQVVKYGYDLNSNLAWQSSPHDETWKTERLHDGHDRLALETTPDDVARKWEYEKGGLLKREEVKLDGTVITERELQWDDLGFLKQETAGPDPAGTTKYTTDRTGRNTKVEDRRGKTTEYDYYPNGWLKEVRAPLGNVSRYLSYHPLGGVLSLDYDGTTRGYAYDAFGRLEASTDAGGHVTRWTYDSQGNVQTVTDALDKVTSYTYDALNRLLVEQAPAEQRIERGYDEEGNLLTYKDALNNLTTYGYDGAGRRTSAAFPGLPAAYSYAYTKSDQLHTETRPRGFVSTFGYDDHDRLQTRTVTQAAQPVETETYTFDGLNRMASAGNPAATVARTYNSFGGVKTETTTVPGSTPRTLTRTFEVGLKPEDVTYPGGPTLHHAYDDLGRLDTITSGGQTVVDYDYDGPERPQTRTQGNLVTSYGYDTARRLQTMRVVAEGTRVMDQSFTWTARNQVEDEVDLMRGGKKSSYEYDDLGRLKKARYGVTAGGASEREVEYELDPASNVTRQTERVGGAYATVKTAEVGPGNRYDGFGGVAMSYDEEGNLASDGERTYGYDWKGRLTSVTQGGQAVTYSYDPLGRKVTRTAGGVTAQLFYDDWNLIQERVNDNVTFQAVNGRQIDEPLQFTQGGVERRVIAERHGTVVSATSPAGKPVERFSLAPYERSRLHVAEHLNHARREEDGSLVLRFSGEMDLEPLTDHPERLTVRHGQSDVEGTWSLQADGREARFEPAAAWPSGDIDVTVKTALTSAAGIEMSQETTFSFDPSDPAGIIVDSEDPAVERVSQEGDGRVIVTFSEAVQDADLATAFRLEEVGETTPVPHVATLAAGGLAIEIAPNEPLTPGEQYTLTLLATKVKDVSGRFAAEADWTWTTDETPTRAWDPEQDANPASDSTVSNRFGFQGREVDPSTSLVDFRNRWFSPMLGRFLSRDPLGYPDGPNAYGAFGGDPANAGDPFGLTLILLADVSRSLAALHTMLPLHLRRYVDTSPDGVTIDRQLLNTAPHSNSCNLRNLRLVVNSSKSFTLNTAAASYTWLQHGRLRVDPLGGGNGDTQGVTLAASDTSPTPGVTEISIFGGLGAFSTAQIVAHELTHAAFVARGLPYKDEYEVRELSPGSFEFGYKRDSRINQATSAAEQEALESFDPFVPLDINPERKPPDGSR